MMGVQRKGPSLHVPSLVDALYSDIRDRILTGQLVGGSPLTEMGLANEYSVARPTAKAAMERLVHEGLLWRASNKTARVPVLDEDAIRDLFFTRTLLEREIMIALAEKEDVPERARGFIDALRQVDHGTDDVVAATVEIDIAFHRSLVEALDSPRLTRLYESLIGEVHLSMAQVQANELISRTTIADEHEAMLKAIETGDADAAVAAMITHLQTACDRLVDYVQAEGSSTDTSAVGAESSSN